MNGALSESERYHAQLMQMFESTEGWEKLDEFDKQDAIKDFMDSLGTLFLDYYQYHLDEAEKIGKIHQDKLINQRKNIAICYVYDLLDSLNSTGEFHNPWETACRGRTNIAAFNTMFANLVDPLPTQGLDEYMEDRRGVVKVSKERIPKNAPQSHWWWFATIHH